MITALNINDEEWKKRYFIGIGGFNLGVFSPRLHRKRSKFDYREGQKEGEEVVRQQRQLHRFSGLHIISTIRYLQIW